MQELKIKQLQYESDTWKRTLGFMIEENVHLKNRIAEILKNGFDKSQLEELEVFQSSFVNEDELIRSVRSDVAEFDKLIVREVFSNGRIETSVSKELSRLRRSIKTAESQFSRLKQEFNSYLLSAV